MGKVSVLAKLSAMPGRRQELLAALEQFFPALDAMPRTEIYAMHIDPKDDDVIWFYELFSDQAGLEAHAGSKALKELTEATAALVAGPPQVTLLSPVTVKGFAL